MDFIRHHFQVIDSTNSWAKRNAHLLARDKITLVTADSQTAGRGRFKRHWVSPPNQNVYATFCFFVEKHHADLGNIPQVLALSAVKVLQHLGFSAGLKWPNDVILSQKKIGGILAETTPLSDQLCMLIGIGINVNMPLEVLQGIDRPATSLFVESGRTYDVEEVLFSLQTQFFKDLTLFIDEGFHPFLEFYRKHISLHQHVYFNDNKTIWEGDLHAINDDGSLTLKLPDGQLKNFIVGEILWPNEIKAKG